MSSPIGPLRHDRYCHLGVVPLGAIVYIVWHGLKITRAQHQSTMAALSTLGDTNKLGYEALSMAVHHLERRVKELEARR
jgi:hypothetical protein